MYLLTNNGAVIRKMITKIKIFIFLFPSGSAGKISTCNVGDLIPWFVPGLGEEGSLENGVATHSTILP